MKRQLKRHLLRSTRSTWCGLGERAFRRGDTTGKHLLITEQRGLATCLTCLKADAAEAKRNG